MRQVRRFLGLIVLASLTAVCANATITPATPSIDDDGCYLIGTAAELYGFAEVVNGDWEKKVDPQLDACGKLTQDIEVNDFVLVEEDGFVHPRLATAAEMESWKPIGLWEIPYEGTFDGQGHVISGLFFEDLNYPYNGFFGATRGATIKNLGIKDAYFDTRDDEHDQVGGIVGGAVGGTTKLTNVFFNGHVAGGLYMSWLVGAVSSYYSTASVEINNCYGTGSYHGDEDHFSPLVRFIDNQGGYVVMNNNYYLKGKSTNLGTSATAEKFADGTIAVLLHSGKGGSIWGQAADASYPDFSGVVEKELASKSVALHSLGEEEQFVYFEDFSTALPEPTKSGYIFQGWYTDANYGGSPITEVPDNAKDLYAKWFEITAPQAMDENGCYKISSANELYGFAAMVNGDPLVLNGSVVEGDANASVCGRLTADIVVNSNVLDDNGNLRADVSGFIPWTPIGSGKSVWNSGAEKWDNVVFTGSFYGDFHTISGLYFNDEDAQHAGLFGYVRGKSRSDIVNIGVVDSYMKAHFNVGGLVGYSDSYYLMIENAFVNGYFSAIDGVGGLVGDVGGSDAYVAISTSYAAGFVDASRDYGALVGAMSSYVGVESSFFLEGMAEGKVTTYGEARSADDFKNGVVAAILVMYSGVQWGQDVTGGDKYPNFSGDIVGAKGIYNVKVHYSSGNVEDHIYIPGYSFSIANSRDSEGDSVVRWSTKPDYSEFFSFYDGFTTDRDTSIYALSIKRLRDDDFRRYYGISTGDELLAYSYLVLTNGSVRAKLLNDIVYNENVLDANGNLNGDGSNFKKWKPIGGLDESGDARPFRGIFDGQGHTVSGLYLDDVNADSVGLFGLVEVNYGGDFIQNVGVKDSYFFAGGAVGGLIGCVYPSYYSDNTDTLFIKNVFAQGSFYASGIGLGGLIGRNESNVRVHNGYAISTLYGWSSVGGLFGYVSGSIDAENAYYYAEDFYYHTEVTDLYGHDVSMNSVENGALAAALHRYKENGVNVGAIWGQDVKNGDKYPNFSGEVIDAPVVKSVVLHYNDVDTEFEYVEGFEELPDVSRRGSVYAGWCLDADCNGGSFGIVPTGTKNGADVYVKWIDIVAPSVDENGCYAIGTAGELYGFAAIVNGDEYLEGNQFVKKQAAADACGKLTANITVNKNVLNGDGSLNKNVVGFAEWTPIGEDLNPFKGQFDGQNYTVSGLYYNELDARNVGLFGFAGMHTTTDVTIRNVGLIDSYIRGEYNVGGVLGALANDAELTIEQVYNAATVVGNYYVGGIVGEVYYDATLNATNVYNIGNIVGKGDVGGIFGVFNQCQAVVANAYNTGNVSAEYSMEGVVGYVYEASITANNIYILGTKDSEYGTAMAEGQFANGFVATLLHDAENGSVWGQNVTNGDVSPNFSGEVIGGVPTKTVVLHYDDKEREYKYVDGFTQLPDLSADGYVLVNWYLNAEFSGTPIAEIPAGTVDAAPIYAKVVKVKRPQVVGNCYEINDANELYGFAAIVNGMPYFYGNELVKNDGEYGACGKLAADITVNENVLNADGTLSEKAAGFVKWTPIGVYDVETFVENPFAGSFDGRGHTISGLYVNDETTFIAGLFGAVYGSPVVTIKNVSVEDSYMHVGGVAGAVVGALFDKTLDISNVYSKGVFQTVGLEIEGEKISFAGGVVGFVSNGSLNVSNAYSVAAVSSSMNAGMIVGGTYNESPKIVVNNSYYTSTAVGETVSNFGDAKTLQEFGDNTVANLLHRVCSEGEENCVDGSIWGQGEAYPAFALKTIVLHYGDTEKTYKYKESDKSLPGLPEGYVLTGWYLDADFTGKPITEIPENAAEGLNIYANVIKVTAPAKDAENCYAIGTAGELYGFAAIVNGKGHFDGASFVTNKPDSLACGKLTANITVNENVLNENGSLSENAAKFAPWSPIGYGDLFGSDMVPFSGKFDGQGHTISGLYINDESLDGVGLFGFVSGMSVSIKNVGVVDSYMHSLVVTGGIVGVVDDEASLTISNVFTKGAFSDVGKVEFGITLTYVGGIVGISMGKLNVYNAYSNASLSGPKYTDVIVGGADTDLTSVLNVFYPEGMVSDFGSAASEEDFENGIVAAILHNYNANGVNGSIWGQDVDAGDKHPHFTNVLNSSKVLVLDWETAEDSVSLKDTLETRTECEIVLVKDGKNFYAEGRIYNGLITDAQIAKIGDNLLYPISGVELASDADGDYISIDGISSDALVIATDIVVDKVVVNREVPKNVFTTIMLPFSIPVESMSGYAFYKFVGMFENEEEKRLEAEITPVTDVLEANTPYIMVASESSNYIEFKIDGQQLTLNTTTGSQESVDGDWKMKGVYENKVWEVDDEELGYAYGFAGQEQDGYKVGEFAKLGEGASASPMHVYLMLDDDDSQLPSPSLNGRGIFARVKNLPQTIVVKVIDGNVEPDAEIEETTVVNRVMVAPAAVKADRWFDLRGRALNGKPTTKGAYYHNGQRVIIK